MWIELFLFFTLIALIWGLFGVDSHTLKLGRKIPGPRAFPIVGNLFDIPTSGADGVKKRADMIETYGQVVRVWMGNILVVLLSDAKDAEVILSSSVHIDKSKQYEFFHPWLGTGLLTSSGKKWHQRRKAITPTFHFKILEQFIDVFNKNGNILVECLQKELDSSSFNIQPYVSRYALDIICESAMGTKVNAQSDTTSEYVDAVRSICKIIYERMNRPWLKNPFIFALLGGLKIQTKALKVLHGLTNKVIECKKAELLNGYKEESELKEDKCLGEKKRIAFLELLLEMAAKSNTIFRNDEDIREEVDTFMFEGHDTTTSAVCFILHLLSKHSHIQDKVYEELKEIGYFGNDLTYQNLLDMKYLERVIKESLRLYPIVPIVARSLTEDVKISSGYTLPAGCIVGVSAYFIHRNPDYYDDPLEFNPDNFLPDPVSERHPFAYIPFSAGPRNCIGQKFAMLELKATVAKIISNYKIEYAGEEHDVIPNPTLVLQSLNGFHVKLVQRKT